ncbi:Leucine-rich repeat-containing protein 71 [Acropora cervicornis]|uniref:Leucine-rich repeat-containing protein 71 n=1 Tax=Acropora cervicornis TaxID=6130 RepID=A0AAD9R492_ACRCE|nr:Leucine-rich repeat-containing protein 71 [Acropora cervicornis]
MFTTLRSVSRMKRAIKKSDRTYDGRLSVATETEEDYMSTFMWYGGCMYFECNIFVSFVEPYSPTGNFQVDFCELCTRAGFPTMQVIPRPHRPPTPSSIPQDSTPIGRQEKKDADRKDDGSKTDDTATVSGVDTEEPPTTYMIKEKYEYFKPRVEVETEEEGNKSYIKEIFIRGEFRHFYTNKLVQDTGWRIDERIMNILTVTLPPLERLTTIDFWNTGLQDNSLNTLATHVIAHLSNLRTLCLDNNPVTFQRYGVFLSEDSTIQNLSLRNCYVNNMGAKMIGQALTTNKSLITLNLCYNKITCEGAGFLAKGLRMNRTLLSLNLGSNLIGDNGASKLAEVRCFAALLSATRKSWPEDFLSPRKPRKKTHVSKEDKKSREKKDAQKKKETKKQEAEKAKKVASTEAVNKGQSKGKKANTTKGDKKQQQPEQEQQEVLEFPNPLLEIPLKEENGEIVIPGNRALINLNLSRNKVDVTGVEAFLISIQRQSEVTSSVGKPTGLMRFSLSEET